MCLLRHAAIAIGCDFDELIADLDAIYPRKFRSFLTRFAERKDKSIEAVGFEEQESPNGIYYGRKGRK